MKFRRCAFLFILLSCLVLSGCGGPEDTYKSAQALLAKGEYAKAGEKFESIGSYEDAATLTMYCKACALCESGDYEAGLQVLATLGGYKDSLYRITYYTARSYEDIAGTDNWEYMLEAQDIYKTIPVFLDSGERITALDKRVDSAKKAQYDAAVKAGESGDYIAARRAFDRLGSYSDSKSRYTYYGIRADEAYLVESTDESAVSSVAARYTQMGAYLDCEKRAAAMEAKVVTILDGKYDAAAALMQEGKHSEALTAFKAIKSYKDSENQIRMCEIAILDGKYDAALMLKNAGKYEEAIAAFKAIGSHKDSAEQINACETAILDGKYDAALALMNAGEDERAYDAFRALRGHKDSVAKADSLFAVVKGDQFSRARVGGYITLGSYEQDNNVDNGEEDIEWLVLAIENNRLLVVSRYGLDNIKYHSSSTRVTWETCSLRKWLNGTFLSTAFNNAERSAIPTVTVEGIYGAKDTQDKVFLLSMDEVNKYFRTISRTCKVTAYAKAQRVDCDSTGRGSWRLRTPGGSYSKTVTVIDDKWLGKNGSDVYYGNTAIRPAMWIEIPQ